MKCKNCRYEIIKQEVMGYHPKCVGDYFRHYFNDGFGDFELAQISPSGCTNPEPKVEA